MFDEPIDFDAIQKDATVALYSVMQKLAEQLEEKYRIPRRISATIVGKAAITHGVSLIGNSTDLPADAALPVARNALKELQRLARNHIKRGGKKRRGKR